MVVTIWGGARPPLPLDLPLPSLTEVIPTLRTLLKLTWSDTMQWCRKMISSGVAKKTMRPYYFLFGRPWPPRPPLFERSYITAMWHSHHITSSYKGHSYLTPVIQLGHYLSHHLHRLSSTCTISIASYLITFPGSRIQVWTLFSWP